MKSLLFLMLSLINLAGGPALAAPSASCQVDWPREFRIEELNSLYDRCMPSINLESFNNRQYISMDQAASIDGGVPQIHRQELQEILDVLDWNNSKQIKLQRTVSENVNGIWKQSQEHYEFTIQNLVMRGAQPPSKNTKRRFFNLKSETGYMPVPLMVQKKANCGGLGDCQRGLRYFRVTYDMFVFEAPGQSPLRIGVNVTYSPDLPLRFEAMDYGSTYFSQIFEACYDQASKDDQGNLHIYQDCNSVVDFQL